MHGSRLRLVLPSLNNIFCVFNFVSLYCAYVFSCIQGTLTLPGPSSSNTPWGRKKKPIFFCVHLFSTWQKLLNFFTYIRPTESTSISYNSVYLILAYVDDFGWWCSTVVERRSLTGELSLSCARPAADGWPLMWVSHPLQVSQLGQLSLSSFLGR